MWYFSYLKDDSITDYSIRYAIGFKNNNYHSEKDLEHINRFIVFINGRTQWIEMNEDIIEDLDISDDTAIITWDHRGQGDSVGKRGYINSYDEYIEDGLKVISKLIPKDRVNRTHHQMLLFGRYYCKSKNPLCENCGLKDICRYKKRNN